MLILDSFDPCVFVCFFMKCLWILIVCCMMIRMLCLIFISGTFGKNLEKLDEDLHDLHRVHMLSRIAGDFPTDFAMKRM